jgi:hypothetical protein
MFAMSALDVRVFAFKSGRHDDLVRYLVDDRPAVCKANGYCDPDSSATVSGFVHSLHCLFMSHHS